MYRGIGPIYIGSCRLRPVWGKVYSPSIALCHSGNENLATAPRLALRPNIVNSCDALACYTHGANSARNGAVVVHDGCPCHGICDLECDPLARCVGRI